jgi:hypothetical protein
MSRVIREVVVVVVVVAVVVVVVVAVVHISSNIAVVIDTVDEIVVVVAVVVIVVIVVVTQRQTICNCHNAKRIEVLIVIRFCVQNTCSLTVTKCYSQTKPKAKMMQLTDCNCSHRTHPSTTCTKNRTNPVVTNTEGVSLLGSSV